jgi:hypothetical protein
VETDPASANHPDPTDLEAAVRTCAHDAATGKVVSTAQAVEELRIMTGDFVSSDRELANAISATAIGMGCAVILDEQAGAGIAFPD